MHTVSNITTKRINTSNNFKHSNLNSKSSDQISRSVVSDSLRPHESQHTRLPCPSPTPGVHSDSRPSSQWCHPAISSSVVPFSSCPQFLQASVFSNESTLRMRWPKYWSFSFSINPSKEIPGLISFRMDWLDLLAVQGTLKSLLQHHSSKASILHLVMSNSLRPQGQQHSRLLCPSPSPRVCSNLCPLCWWKRCIWGKVMELPCPL